MVQILAYAKYIIQMSWARLLWKDRHDLAYAGPDWQADLIVVHAMMKKCSLLAYCNDEGEMMEELGCNARREGPVPPLQSGRGKPLSVEGSRVSLPALLGEGAGMLQILQCGLNLSPRSMLSSKRVAAISSCTHAHGHSPAEKNALRTFPHIIFTLLEGK